MARATRYMAHRKTCEDVLTIAFGARMMLEDGCEGLKRLQITVLNQ